MLIVDAPSPVSIVPLAVGRERVDDAARREAVDRVPAARRSSSRRRLTAIRGVLPHSASVVHSSVRIVHAVTLSWPPDPSEQPGEPVPLLAVSVVPSALSRMLVAFSGTSDAGIAHSRFRRRCTGS